MRRTRRLTSLAVVARILAPAPLLALLLTLAPALALAPAAARAEVGDTARSPAPAPADGNGGAGCLTFVSQFRGAVLYHAGSPRLAQAQRLAREGEALCARRAQGPAKAKLKEALRLLGVTPKGAPPAPPVEIRGAQPAPAARMAVRPQGLAAGARGPETHPPAPEGAGR